MKLFGFVGTAHKPSYTANIMEKLSEELKRKGIIDTSVIVTGSDADVTMCKGCLSCYQSGNCVFDDSDDMSKLMTRQLESYWTSNGGTKISLGLKSMQTILMMWRNYLQIQNNK